MTQHPHTLARGRWLIRVGGVVFAVGAVAAVVALVPLVSDAIEPHASLWFFAVGGIGIGMGLALWGLVVDARARSRYFGDAAAGSATRLGEPPHG